MQKNLFIEQNKSIKIKDQDIDYKIRKSKRAKRLRLAVYCDTKIIVTIPYRANENIIEKFLYEKANWLLAKIKYFQNNKNNIFNNLPHNDYQQQKNKALEIVESIIDKYNKDKRFKFNKIKIKNQKTRWGSCSSRSNININYKIVHLPEKVAEYIVVHELCHLLEFNHSKKFWNLVSIYFPDYLEIKKNLKVIK